MGKAGLRRKLVLVMLQPGIKKKVFNDGEEFQ